jgi:alcohol dehydrogenase (NADP+)
MKLLLALSALVAFSECRNKQAPLNILSAQTPLTIPLSQPLLGFGTWNLKESESNTTDAVAIAIESGYRQIDSAAAYRNEREVGKGIAKGLEKSGLAREDIWVTSKLWNDQ